MTLLKWRVIMLIGIMTAIVSTVVGAFAPHVVSLYLQYTKEPTAPKLVTNHPYSLPLVGMGTLIALLFVSLAFVLIRQQRKDKKASSELEARIAALERRNICDI